MASHEAAGYSPDASAQDINSNGLSGISQRLASISRRQSRRSSKAAKSAPTSPIDRTTTVIVRKKLPWLDGSRIPGQFDSKDSLGLGDKSAQPPSTNRKPVPPVHADPALRPVGSTPSLRNATRSKEFNRSMSLSSQPRPGIKPVASRADAKQRLGIVNKDAPVAESASSQYSLPSSPDRDERVRRDDSYERLVPEQPPFGGSTVRNPFTATNEWLGHEHTFPPEGSASPRQHTNGSRPAQERQVSPRQRPKPPARRPSSESDGQQDAEIRVRAQLSNMPKAKTLPRRSIPVPPFELPPVPPTPPPTRKPTLFAIPTHLWPSSSSSSPAPLLSSPPQSVAVREPDPPVPLSSPPPAHARTLRQDSKSLNRAVTGLENLMQEALTVAKDAAKTGRNDEVAGILDSATIALRKASTVNGQLSRGRASKPLRLSPAVSEHNTDSGASVDHYSDASSMQSGHHSEDTAPTLVTKSARSSRPTLVGAWKSDGYSPESHRASIETMGNHRAVRSPDRHSISQTPPRLYQPPSADSIVRDFAYARAKTAKAERARWISAPHGSADEYYYESRQAAGDYPRVRPSRSAPVDMQKQISSPPMTTQKVPTRRLNSLEAPKGRRQRKPGHVVEPVPTQSIPPRTSSRNWNASRTDPPLPRRRHDKQHRPRHIAQLFESSYYHPPPKEQTRAITSDGEKARSNSAVTDTRYDPNVKEERPDEFTRYSGPTTFLQRNVSLRHPRRKHISLHEGQGFSLGRYHRRQPIAREWGTARKRITAAIACLNTMFVGLITGIYAGEVPRIQYQLADTTHKVILGNVVLFAFLGATTLIFWPLPLLHGRKPYTLLAFALMLPLMFPQAIVVSNYRNPNNPLYRCGLLIPRAFQGIAMGFANINFLPTLFDLFGASLMSTVPHQEIVVYDDVRRQGGGVGIWLGIWSFSFVGSMSIGFFTGAMIISSLDPSWGLYIVVILLAFFLLVNVIAPETRRAPYRRSIAQFLDGGEKIKRRVARGEVKLHISNDGPKWWFEEVWAGLVLTMKMVLQPGYFIMMAYLGWMYAQVTLVILLLGALLTRDYKWQPQYVGPAVLSVAIGAFLAVPLSKANLFSRARDAPQRTDSMTMKYHHQRVHWSSHMLRRCIFTLTLPLAAIAYTLSSYGPTISWVAPTIFCGLVGFLSNLAIAECVGIIMETFDTCDLQPGVNQKHRLQSMAETTRRRRTNYSSFPRICAGFFAAQSTGFFLSAAATGVSGDITRAVGAQMATAIVAAILLVLTVLFILVLYRWKAVQVIPNSAFGTFKNGIDWGAGPSGGPGGAEDPEWRAVIIGNPSGKMRRVNLLEMGTLSRWTEIRRLNKLVRK